MPVPLKAKYIADMLWSGSAWRRECTLTVLPNLQDAKQAVAPCTPTILIVDEACAQFRNVAEHVRSITNVIDIGAS